MSDDWQPMATAPKDGTKIIACWKGDGVSEIGTAYYGDGCWRDPSTDERYSEPEKWQPLPKAS